MASKLLCILLLTIVCAANADNFRAQHPSLPILRSETVAHQPRRNLAYAVNYAMDKQILTTGLDRLQYLLDYNTKNKELLQDLNRTFQKHSEYTWHLALEDDAAGDIPEQFVFFRFDRNTTGLFVGGYRGC